VSIKFRQRILYVDGQPDKNGELFAPWAIKNFHKTIPVRNGAGATIGVATLQRAKDKDEEGSIFALIEVQDPSLFGREVNISLSAQVFDCSHRFKDGKSIAVRMDDADVTEVVLDGDAHPDTRIGKVIVLPQGEPHDGAGTEPEE
jgi:hypothetical protein